jgi:hypothetical protein
MLAPLPTPNASEAERFRTGYQPSVLEATIDIFRI